MDYELSRRAGALRDAESGPGVHIGDAPLSVVLLYPSPYTVAMSSLGYMQIHRLANEVPGVTCERAMLPDRDDVDRYRQTCTPLFTLERQRDVHEAEVIAVSHAYELELAGLVIALELAGLEPLAADRTAADPLIVLGGPITFSNPMPSAPFADVLLLGEAEDTWVSLLRTLVETPEAARGSAAARQKLLEDLAGRPGYYVPSIHGDYLPPVGQAEDASLPAHSAIRTPNTELSGMMLIEPERGCHRGCTFCVMRRSTNGGMRLVSPERVRDLVPDDAEKVGLVGAAVTDHPGIKSILRSLVDDRGKRVGISSLRADRLDDEFVGLLARGGYRSMTVALDAASVRLRDTIEKNLKDTHVRRAAELAKAHGMRHLKLYVIVGLPGETYDDREELIAFARELSKILPLVLGVSPLIPKFHTPLADAPFMGEAEVQAALTQLKRGLAGRAEVRGPGAREAYVEYRLAQGGHAHAHAAIAAAKKGGKLGAWKKALADLPERVRPSNFQADLIPAATVRRRHLAVL